MKKLLCAGLAAASICMASPKPAEAWGGGFAFGTVLGLGVGTVLGSAVARPYYPYGYAPYGYYPYGYYPYATPYAYGYPPPVTYAVPPVTYAVPPVTYAVPPMAYAPPGYPAPPGGQAYAAARPPAAQPTCRPGQFFNTLTGNCDRR